MTTFSSFQVAAARNASQRFHTRAAVPQQPASLSAVSPDECATSSSGDQANAQFMPKRRWAMGMRLGTGALCVAAALLLIGCSTAHYPINPPLQSIDARTGYRIARVFARNPEDHLFVHISFSGGGVRASALGFGVLEALRDQVVLREGKRRRLVDEIDMVMGVSGGSMLAAAFALGGAEGLPRFETDFLRAPLEYRFVDDVLNPGNLWRMASPRFGRSDLLAEFLDERLYHGATFQTLGERRDAPYTIIYASDMLSGERFEFTQDQFDFLCSDLDGVTLARAVAASSAVPMVLSPVTVLNHAPTQPDVQGCGEPLAREFARTNADGAPQPRRLNELDDYRAIRGHQLIRPYVHLVDGGLADNVSARGPMEFISQFGGVINGTRFAGKKGLRRVLFIVVNAESRASEAQDAKADVPSPLRTALALADIPINRNSELALRRMRATLSEWQSEVASAHAQRNFETFADDARFYLAEINLHASSGVDSQAELALQDIRTTLQLPPAQVDALRAHGRRRLMESPDFNRFLEELPSPSTPSPLSSPR